MMKDTLVGTGSIYRSNGGQGRSNVNVMVEDVVDLAADQVVLKMQVTGIIESGGSALGVDAWELAYE
jgi:hypothetical protein